MGLLRSVGRVAVASKVHGSVQRRQRQRWAQQDAAQQDAAQQDAAQKDAAEQPSPASAPAAAPPAPHGTVSAPQVQGSAREVSTEEMLGLLAQLGSLRDSGVLTEEEFAEQKARILRGRQPR